jgi:glycosyltransferase involved in cell wall biosynthesis
VFHSEVGALREQVRRENLQSRVTFTGYVPDLELVDWYHSAACLVLPSYDEGFGLPVVEAMACGTPVVASSAGAMPELVADDAGLLIEPNKPEQIVEALRKLVLADGTLASRLRAAGLERAAALSWDQAAVALRAIFDEIAPRPIQSRTA